MIWLWFELNGTDSLAWSIVFWVLLSLNVFFNLASCWALGDSFKRMIALKDDSKNLVVNYKMMIAHIVSYAVYILSLALYFGALAGYD